MWEFITAYTSPLINAFTDLGQRTHWLYLLSALAAGALSYHWYVKKPFSIAAFLAWALPAKIYFHRSAIMDYVHFILRPMWLGLLFGQFMLGADVVSEGVAQVLDAWLGAQALYNPTLLESVFYTFAVFMGFEFGQFYGHYLAHRVWFLWEFHKIHHSAQVLQPLTAYRFHPVDDIFLMAAISSGTGLVHGIFVWWWGGGAHPLLVYGVEITAFIFYIAAYNLRHAHIWLSYPPAISHILMSPAQHQIHHSSEERHWDKNMGFSLSLYDWIFGTLYVPTEKEEFRFGLNGGEDADYQDLPGFYFTPFKKIVRRLGRKQSSTTTARKADT